MNILKTVELIDKYGKCPKCGSDKLGNGKGSLVVEDKTFYRSCQCGWSIKTNEEGEIIND